MIEKQATHEEEHLSRARQLYDRFGEKVDYWYGFRFIENKREFNLDSGSIIVASLAVSSVYVVIPREDINLTPEEQAENSKLIAEAVNCLSLGDISQLDFEK